MQIAIDRAIEKGRKNKIKVVFWVTENELTRISLEAPDFFAFRNRVVEFMETPLSEEKRSSVVDFALQTEYRSPEEIKQSIELKEKLLSELSGKDEISGYLLSSLGTLSYQISSYKKAIEYHEKALVIAKEIGDRRGEGYQRRNLGYGYNLLKQTGKSIENYQQALAIGKEIKHPQLINFCQKKLGIVPDKTAESDGEIPQK
jgi:tetratricopeptide (TPR) repeat protein